jgi:hypothetical protein
MRILIDAINHRHSFGDAQCHRTVFRWVEQVKQSAQAWHLVGFAMPCRAQQRRGLGQVLEGVDGHRLLDNRRYLSRHA